MNARLVARHTDIPPPRDFRGFVEYHIRRLGHFPCCYVHQDTIATMAVGGVSNELALA